MKPASISSITSAPQQLSQSDYEAVREFLERSCGIVLGDNKHYLVSSRLSRVVREAGLASLAELVARLRRGGDTSLQMRVIDAMTTNETSWFRDGHPYEILRNAILPEWADRRLRNARIWSAACSSGQEPYSISIVIEEFLRGRPGSLAGIQVTATDISPSVLEGARAAVFDDAALNRGISPQLRQRYFEPHDGLWRLRKSVRERVIFKQLNLLQSFVSLGKFDCIFCRNVLIYFSSDVKQDILARIARALRPGGYLFLGGSESLGAQAGHFETVRFPRGHVYRLKA
ncbi:MAG TPA: protein-glutamate O-methyltransferase CheR [Gammaproteobacteria bacterium]|nr:protein-glutamate O-methyltransferase CheR [Gammaproteobacteria bacterium]